MEIWVSKKGKKEWGSETIILSYSPKDGMCHLRKYVVKYTNENDLISWKLYKITITLLYLGK